MNRFGASLVTLAILFAAFAAVGCSRAGGDLVIRSNGEYNQVLQRAQALSQTRLEAIEAGGLLTKDDIDAFQEAIVLFEALSAYQPSKYSLYLGSGRLYQVLGNDEMAVMRFRQCVNNAPREPDPEAMVLTAQASVYMAQSYLVLQRYEEALEAADAAVGAFPDNPDYLSIRASAFVQLQRVDEAIVDLEKALRIDTDHVPSRDLMKLIELARSSP
jgi:tetratricopeptide (TPR) repeat protein